MNHSLSLNKMDISLKIEKIQKLRCNQKHQEDLSFHFTGYKSMLPALQHLSFSCFHKVQKVQKELEFNFENENDLRIVELHHVFCVRFGPIPLSLFFWFIGRVHSILRYFEWLLKIIENI